MCKKGIRTRPVLYTYEKISSSPFWEEFMGEIKKGNPIRKVDWYKKLGFNNVSSLIVFLKKYKIDHKTATFTNSLSKEKLKELAFDYQNSDLSIKEIQTKYNMCDHSIHRLIGKEKGSCKRKRFNNLTNRIIKDKNVSDTLYGKACNLLTENKIPFKINLSGKTPLIILKCAKCGNEIERASNKILLHYSKYKEFGDVCRKCYDNIEASSFASKKLLSKKNTTGYVGIQFYISSSSREYIGYTSSITFKHKRLVRKYFPDDTLSDKTLMEAVVYRELYIIKNKLPHTRNLNDEELFSNLQMLGQYLEYEEIKNILNEQIMLKIFT